jgi:hypothetical protein
MGCALLVPLGMSPDGQRVAEIGAFCVDVVFRGTGRGDSLLDYVEQVRLQQHVVLWLGCALLQQCRDGLQRHGARRQPAGLCRAGAAASSICSYHQHVVIGVWVLC